MPEGMIGFAERRFILLSPDNNGCFFWFQSVDNPALAFVVTDPTAFVPGYEVTLTPDEYEKLKIDPELAEIIFLAVTNIHHDSTSNITINLQGPVVVNPIKMVAKQIVLENAKYGIRHPLFTAPDAGTLPDEKGRSAPGRLPAENYGALQQPLAYPLRSIIILKFQFSCLRADPAFVAKQLRRSRQRYRPPPPKQPGLWRPVAQARLTSQVLSSTINSLPNQK